MKIERTKNATRNIIYGFIVNIYQVIVPFFMRTAMIYVMGVEYLGLNSLFASILQVLNLAELGVGRAMVYSMYKPIAEDDTKTICALMSLYRKYYRIIGIVIGVIGLFILPFVPDLVSGDIPGNLNIYILYLLNLGATVLSYWLFAYKNCLLTAHQRLDIASKVALIINTITYIVQFIVLVLFHNYYFYLVVTLFSQVLSNISIALVTIKMYPNYSPKGKLDKSIVHDIGHRIADLFTSKIGGVVVNSVDTIVISMFLGLTALAIYQNYFYILNSIIGFVAIIFSGCTAGIGNSIIVETNEKNYNDLKKFTFLIVWLSGFCVCCLLCLYQPFMELWVGKELCLDFSAVIMFCIYYFVYEINQLLNTYKDAAGIWHQDRFRPLVTALVNLIMNLVMVQFIGLYGVLLSTVLSMLCVGMPWILHNLFSVLFDKKQLKSYIRKLLYYVVCVIFSSICTYICCSFVTYKGWSELIIKAIICCIIPNLIYILIFYKENEFAQCLQLVDNITKGHLNLVERFKIKDRIK